MRRLWLPIFVLLVHVFVIVWGAFVRISFSGDGCGNHWPLCNGSVLPTSTSVHTLIEYSHRLTSGLAVLSVIYLVVSVRREEAHVRRAAWAALFFDMMEAVIGMLLVKLRLVGDNPSMKRAFSGSLHLVNTFLLLGALTLTLLFLMRRDRADTGDKALRSSETRVASQMTSWRSPFALLLAGGAATLLVVAMSGAVAAFGDTLYRVSTLREALSQDFSPTSTLLLRLRVFHPALAIIGGVSVFGIATATRWLRPVARSLARCTMALVAAQLLLGIANVFFLAPTVLQLAHLLLAQALWIAYVAMSATSLMSAAPKVSTADKVIPEATLPNPAESIGRAS